MRLPWGLLLLPSLAVSAGLLVLTQFVFIRASFFRDLRFGRVEEVFQFTNYIAVLTDPFYVRALALTIEISAAVAALALAAAYPSPISWRACPSAERAPC